MNQLISQLSYFVADVDYDADGAVVIHLSFMDIIVMLHHVTFFHKMFVTSRVYTFEWLLLSVDFQMIL